MEQSFIAYVRLQIKSFRNNFIKSTSRKNFDEIHDYRVALKRIRNLINFIKQIPGSKNLKKCFNINNLQLAFRSGGILREMQINRIILLRYEQKMGVKYRGLRKYIDHKEKTAFKDLKYARNKFSAKKLKKFEAKVIGTLQEIPSDSFVEYIDRFIEKRIAQIKELVKGKNVESTLHRIRRLTKSIKYLLEMSKTRSKSFGDLKFEIEIITELEDLIGNWHDQQVFKSDLGKYISSVKKRKPVDKDSMKLMSIVKRDYNKIFNQTVQAVYDHYKISVRVME
jgi:CHAD domain-containing protein